MQPARRKLTDSDKAAIRDLVVKKKSALEIARQLDLPGQRVNGFISTIRGQLFPVSPGAPRPMMPPTQEEQVQALAKSWRKSEPDAEFSVHTGNGQKLYIAAYKEGLVVRIGKDKKVALLTPLVASRVGMKIGEMANWCRMPR